jgi:AmiR/NasT family two-component response regulator
LRWLARGKLRPRARADRKDRAGSRLPADRPAPRARSGVRQGGLQAGRVAYITDADADDWQGSIDIVLRRFTEYHDLEGAFGRRALTERAKGILMERHSVDETSAFEMLREHSRIASVKLVDLATAVVDGHRLLPKQP